MILFLLLILFNVLIGLMLPWWAIIPVVYALCFALSKNLKTSLLIPFSTTFILLLVLNFYYSLENNHVLARRVAELFGIGESKMNWLWLVFLGPLPSAICASFAGASGFLSKQVLFKK